MPNKLKQPVIVHVDMDAFFAAVEELYMPDLKGKPVIIGADPKNGQGRGVVSTANYEARKYGIQSAMPISKAYRLCPGGIFLRPDSAKYSLKSRKIMEVLGTFSPLVEQVSIDEAFLDCSGCEELLGTPRQIGSKIKERILDQTGLTASVGIAVNKSLAKIASDFQKPDGLTIIMPGDEKEFLYPLPITKLWGIGQKSQGSLNSLGVYLIRDIISKEAYILQKMGKHGEHILNMAKGKDDRPVISTELNKSIRKSISKESTFGKDTNDHGKCEQVIVRLVDDIARILRREGMAGKTVSIKVRLSDFSTFSRSITLNHPLNETQMIRDHALSLFRAFYDPAYQIRLLGVHISGLVDQKHIPTLLLNEKIKKERKIDQVMDAIKNKFGRDLISRADLKEE